MAPIRILDQSRQTSTPPAAARSAVPVAQIEDLHVTFERRGGQVKALRGVDLELAQGEIFGLVGESGSGKSVLGLALLGLLPNLGRPEVTGKASVGGVDMLHALTSEQRQVRRRDLGAVFQDPMTSLNPTMRIGQQVIEASGTKEEAIRLLDAVGVPEPAKRLRVFPHELSGGLRQRVMIAMALAGRPKLVVADEPTTALDVTVQAQILALIRELCDELGTTFVLITHDLGVAAQVADRIGVLYGGRMAEVGNSAEVLSSPMHPYTVGLLRSRLTMTSPRRRPLPTLPGEPPDPRQHPPGCPFGPRCGEHTDACDVSLPPLAEPRGHPGRASACIRIEELAPQLAIPIASAAEAPAADPAGPDPTADAQAPRPAAVTLTAVAKSFVVRDDARHKQHLRALRGVDLQVNEGESVALVGESGCGKSTLLRVVAGLMEPDGGTITLGPGARPQMVFQDAGASLTPWLSVGELVGERLIEERVGRGERQERVRNALSLVGLPADIASAKASQLSGGQRQRVGLARAVVVPPEVLLCDEPTSALDVSLAATVLNMLKRLRETFNMAVIFVTHDLAAARVVADRIAVMYLGEIVEDGPAEEIAADPLHPYTRALLASVPSKDAVRIPVRGEPASPLNPPAGCAFSTRCPHVQPRCVAEKPPFLPNEDGSRAVACWLHVPATAGSATTEGAT
jgi:peptide/nickel transport system ATP-binding protein